MPAVLGFFLKLLPFFSPLAEKLFPAASAKAEELRAEKELVEARAFAKGRISPAYLLKFVCVALFAVFGSAFAMHLFFPETFPASPIDELKELFSLGEGLFRQ
ncbi:MAG: hypothetical protein LBD42_04635 [Desulfovibrio sp.]|jgi:hypothetical protein|nr:hypothetical protein [Desulfovibrio sp.]